MCGGCYSTEKQPVHEGPKLGRRALLKGLVGGSAIAAVPACDSVASAFTPPRDQMAQLAGPEWNKLKSSQKISRDPRYTSRVARVAPKILRAAGENPSEWEVVVFADKSLNAFALPGNKIGIFTGILDIMENDDQIAVVMGHEVAHVQRNHSGQRYGRAMVAQLGMSAADAVMQNRGMQNRQVFMQAIGIGAQVGYILPFSREHETESDVLGLSYMPKAGYQPREAVAFWTNMANAKNKAGGGAPPEFLSTHPADSTRIERLKAEVLRMGYSL